MKDLTSIQCIPCSAGAPKATKEELAAFQEQCPDWQVQEVHGVKRVTRRFLSAIRGQPCCFASDQALYGTCT